MKTSIKVVLIVALLVLWTVASQKFKTESSDSCGTCTSGSCSIPPPATTK